MKLAQLQKQFAAHLYEPQKNKIFDFVKQKKVPTEKLLQIYRNNVFGNFENTLEMIYPTVKKLVGDDYFEKLAILYNQQYQSPSGNLDDYGKYFSKLILSSKKEHKLIYLQEIAMLEWLYHYAYFSRDLPDLDIQKLQNLKSKDYYKVKFKLHPSCYLLASKHPLYSIWQSAGKKINLKNKFGEFILITRSEIFKLEEIEYLFLENIKNGKNIFDIYKILNKKNSDFDIGSLINKYISMGVLAKFSV